MKIEKIRKSHKKEIIIGVLAICIVGGALTFATSKAKYKLTQDIPLVRGTVNYKVPDLRIVALYTANDSGNYIESEDVPISGYQLNTEKSMCKGYDGTTSIENAPKDDNAMIEYKDGAVTFTNITKKNTRCYLYFDLEHNIKDTILANTTLNLDIPDFSKTSCAVNTNLCYNDMNDADEPCNCDEQTNGLYKGEDDYGVTYYFRGTVDNNWVKLGDFYWRIIRINGDGTIRLIYSGKNSPAVTGVNTQIGTSPYNTSYNTHHYVGFEYESGNIHGRGTNSTIKNYLINWYNNNLLDYESKIASGNGALFCNDRNIASSSTNFYSYSGNTRLSSSSPTFKCLSEKDIFNDKIGLITQDEVHFAGSNKPYDYFTYNYGYYLATNQNYWTMTPIGSNPIAGVSFVNSTGMINGLDAQLDVGKVNNNLGVRPVINLRSDVTFNKGSNGTQGNPYIVQ